MPPGRGGDEGSAILRFRHQRSLRAGAQTFYDQRFPTSGGFAQANPAAVAALDQCDNTLMALEKNATAVSKESNSIDYNLRRKTI